ncbi:hypothetical protein PX699_03300 [Sphingobium sp. H39-3-25]|nr:hypothetical protein [Sphingobium arseniciresistens]
MSADKGSIQRPDHATPIRAVGIRHDVKAPPVGDRVPAADRL